MNTDHFDVALHISVQVTWKNLLIRRNEDTFLMFNSLAKMRHLAILIIMSTSEDTVSVNLGEQK